MSNACSPQEEYSIALDTLCIVCHGLVWFGTRDHHPWPGADHIESQPQRTKDMEFGEITFFHYNIVICCCCRGQQSNETHNEICRHINNNVAFHVSKEVFQRPRVGDGRQWPSPSTQSTNVLEKVSGRPCLIFLLSSAQLKVTRERDPCLLTACASAWLLNKKATEKED